MIKNNMNEDQELELRHTSRYTPEGVVVKLQRSEPGRDGKAIGESVEVVSLTDTIRGITKHHRKNSGATSAREAAAIAMGQKKK